jgi:hypothetical protein
MEYKELTPSVQKDMPSLSAKPQVAMPTGDDATGGGAEKPKPDAKTNDNAKAEDAKAGKDDKADDAKAEEQPAPSVNANRYGDTGIWTLSVTSYVVTGVDSQ